MPLSNSNKEQYILDLESKVEVLEKENSQLVERGEETLLLGIVSERINVMNDIDQVLAVGLENISILKDIPFCACCTLHESELLINKYYYSESNDPLTTKKLDLPEQVRKKILSESVQLSRGDCKTVCSTIKFEPKNFSPTSLLFVPTKSKLRRTEVFCFVVSDSSERLTLISPLLERIVEIISARIDNISLVKKLNEMNQILDQKVQERTKELTVANRVLRQNEEKFRSLFNGALDMIHFIDRSGKILDANPVELETLKYSRDEYIGKPLIDLIAPDFKEKSKNALQKVISGEEVKGLHTVMIARDGSRIDVEVNAVPEMVEGKVVQSRAIIRNITDRKQVEENLQKIKKLESVGILAGGIAHDFNNILSAILGNLSLAKLYSKPKDKIFNLLSEAEKASLRATNLTQQLLTFAKGGEPVKEIASVVNIIKDSAEFVLRGSNLLCNFMFAENLWPVEIDTGQISQVIQNLIINSRQSMPLGGSIDVISENFNHDQSQLLPIKLGRYIKITIKDRGTGIPENLIDKIFDPYFSTKQEGSGLGLAITHSIIRKHQGHIGVESKPGDGTTFIIFLPATEKIHETYQEEHEVEYMEGKGKIMIMDDDEMVRKIAKAMLSQLGYEVVLAKDGEEAVAIYKNENNSTAPIDIIIMDLTIPGGMGGKDAALEIHKFNPDAKIIVSSGYSNDPIMANCREYGFCSAIVKPYQLQELMRAVGEALSQSEN